MKPPSSPWASKRPYQRTGLYAAQRCLAAFGSRALPGPETDVGRELREWRAALVADLGGEDAISTQQRALIEMAVATRLLVSSVDGYLFSMPALVDRRHRRLWGVGSLKG